MVKLGFFTSLTAIVIALGVALGLATSNPASADDNACKHKELKTEMVKQACDSGGQKAAKDAMKAFMKDKKIKSCNQCHAKLAPGYELKNDGFDQFKKLGGKMLDDKPAK